MEEKLYSIRDAAALIGYASVTIAQYVQLGVIPCVRAEKKHYMKPVIFIKESDLLDFKNNKARQPKRKEQRIDLEDDNKQLVRFVMTADQRDHIIKALKQARDYLNNEIKRLSS